LSREPFQRFPNCIDLKNFIESESSDTSAPVVLDFQKAFGGQPTQCLAYGTPADAGLGAKFTFNQPLTRCIAPVT
jgi:hypothetical protein